MLDAVSIPVLVIIAIVVLYLLNSIKILREYERGVIFRLGRALPQPKGPGIILVFRPIDQMVRISLAARSAGSSAAGRDHAGQRDDQSECGGDALRRRPRMTQRLRWLTMSTRPRSLRRRRCAPYWARWNWTLCSAIATNSICRIQSIIDQRTEPFGVKVTSVEVKQVDLPETMTRAMAKQAEAERERRSKIIHAEGEFNAAQKLVDAAALLATQPMTLQLRYLQTLTEIGVEKNTTIVFPLPMELMSLLNKFSAQMKPAEKP